ncbi:MAG: acetylxylan esterase [Ginsengibacter sp.]
MNNCFSKINFCAGLKVIFIVSVFPITTFAINPSSYDRAIDSVPHVFDSNKTNLIENILIREAALKYPLHPLPQNKTAWDAYRIQLKNRIIKKTGALLNQKLPLNLQETGNVQMPGYSIKNIAFQTRPGIYATANLYIPEGTGKFPGVIVMMGHSTTGRLYDKYQSVGITLALHGYVGLCIDPWGSGERTTIHGVFEDHGDENNLGFALMDIGESLMGMQVTDNTRGVDLLDSLPYVDHNNIGATGSSGGGNQTIWLTAMDDRIKAAVPVVSAGTYESFVMGSPCICEVLTDALTFTEESGVLALIAPRSIKMCNHEKDANAAFNPREMLRSYKNAQPVFRMLGAEANIAYDTFNLTHGYWPEDRESMLGWFNLHLKGTGAGARVTELPFNTLPNEKIMVYASGKRDPGVSTTEKFCKQKGKELRNSYLKSTSFDIQSKRAGLKNILRVNEKSILKKIHNYGTTQNWQKIGLATSDNKLIPVLLYPPGVASKEIVVVSGPGGKESISPSLIEELIKSGSGIALVDLSGTGETASPSLHSYDSVGRLRVLSKSYLLLGKTVLGEWVKELGIVERFIHNKYPGGKVSLYGIKEAGLACLYLAALGENVASVSLYAAPVSYLFDNRDSIEFFSTGIHLPGFLNWGDVSLASALSEKNITFINPVSMSGRPVTGQMLQACKKEFEQERKIIGRSGKTIFN